jgi:hypothetical protein
MVFNAMDASWGDSVVEVLGCSWLFLPQTGRLLWELQETDGRGDINDRWMQGNQ